jgi:hypothetical protein
MDRINAKDHGSIPVYIHQRDRRKTPFFENIQAQRINFSYGR